MGIPSFYRWLVKRYPRIVSNAIEETPQVVDGVTIPIDTTSPNPNGIEFDNLYLDMNAIIHPCFHPENSSPPTTYDEVFQAVFKYIDRLFSIVRPRKLLYMAIDGVAPRAKMNQQRARRFRAAKDLSDQDPLILRLLNESVTHAKEENDNLDSNIITPGTEFMELLSSALQYYIHLRMNNDPCWEGIKVIFSDATVPGEGEHKIVSFIRLQRNLPGFDPNTRHCLYGLDADLIMLALATHEVYFTVLREIPSAHRSSKGDQQKRLRSGDRKPNQGKCFANQFDKILAEQMFQLVRIWVLRDYLAHDLQIPAPNTNIDFERLIDDFVFMCIFVGNDFLPHIPSLEIREGAIDLLMMTYKKEFVQMGGYLTMSSEVNLQRVEHFIKAIGTYELPLFSQRNRVVQARAQKKTCQQNLSAGYNWRTGKTGDKDLAEKTTREVNLGEDGWRERYYALKFEIQNDDKGELIRKDAVNKYVEGICWVMHYYYHGICSWNWFYPYHYAPFASDFQGIGQLEMRFDIGRPLKPFDQLMGVLPAASAQALPFSYRQLMTDPSSSILDFYPKDFEVDLNGKRHSWQGVCKLPFIDASRLLAEIAKVEHTLTDSEVRRNTLGQDVLFIYQTHPLAKIILSFWEEVRSDPKLPDSAIRKEIIDPVLSGGMNGYIYIPAKPICPAEVDSPIGGMVIIDNNKVISVNYEAPSSHPHISKLPDGLVLPKKCISKDDIRPPAFLWYENTAVMRNRCSQRRKPPNSISGPNFGKIARKLVSEYCVSNEDHKVASELWQKRLNKKGEKESFEVGLTSKTKNQRRTGNTREKDNDETSKVPSSGGTSNKNDIQLPYGNQLKVIEVEETLNHDEGEMKEKDGGVKLTKSQRSNRRKKISKMKRNNDETSKVLSAGGDSNKNDIQLPCGNQLEVEETLNQGVGEMKETDCGVKLTKSQKSNRRKRINKMKSNNDETSKFPSSGGNSSKNDIQIPCGNQHEVVEVEETLHHCEGEMKEKDGGYETSKVQPSIGKENDIQFPCGNQLEVAEIKEILNLREGENRENDSGVELTETLKRRGRGNKMNRPKVETSTVQPSSCKENDIQFLCGNQPEVPKVEEILDHGEGEKKENDGGIELTATRKRKRGNKTNRPKLETSTVQLSSDKENNIQFSCGNQLEVPEVKEILNYGEGEKKENGGGVEPTATRKRRRGNKMNRPEVETSMVQTSSGKENDIQFPCANQPEVPEVKEILNNGEGEKKESDSGVELTAIRKRKRGNKMNKPKVEISTVQSTSGKENDIQFPCGNQPEVPEVEEISYHGEGEKKENDGGVELTATQKRKRTKVNPRNRKNDETSNFMSYSGNSNKNDVQSPCGNHLEVAERKENGIDLGVFQRREQTHIDNAESNKVQPACANRLVKNMVAASGSNTETVQGMVGLERNGETVQGMVGLERNGETNKTLSAPQINGEFNMAESCLNLTPVEIAAVSKQDRDKILKRRKKNRAQSIRRREKKAFLALGRDLSEQSMFTPLPNTTVKNMAAASGSNTETVQGMAGPERNGETVQGMVGLERNGQRIEVQNASQFETSNILSAPRINGE